MTANDMPPRTVLDGILVDEYLTRQEFDDLLDSLAMDVIRKAAVAMRRAWKADHFGVHDEAGVYAAMEYLINLISAGGEIRTGVIGRDMLTWCFDGTDA